MENLKEYFSKKVEITNNKEDRISTKELFNSYCEEKKGENINQRKFNNMVNELGIIKKETNGKTYFPGLKYKTLEIKPLEITKIPEISSPEKIMELAKPVVREYIKFKDCCLHIPTFICIKETPKLNYLMTNKVDLETIKNKLLRVRYFETVKECCDFYVNLEEEIIKTKINDDLKIASLIFLTGAVYSKYNKNRGLIICDTYKEFEKIKINKK